MATAYGTINTETAPYMHAGQLQTLREVLEHYDCAPAAPEGKSELEALNLTAQDKPASEAFLQSPSPKKRVVLRRDLLYFSE